MGPVGKERSALGVILLTIITLGIYGLYWQYAVFKENKDYSGQGIGGGLALVIAIFIGIVNCFLLPSEISAIQRQRGMEPTVSGLTGCWILLPLIGWFVWLVKVQHRMNELWSTAPAAAAATPAA